MNKPETLLTETNFTSQHLKETAQVDSASVQPLPNSRKIYLEGSRPDIRVPFRSISQATTATDSGEEKNPDILVYDTSGPYTDPEAKIDIRQGLASLRAKWIEERQDTELLDAPTSDFEIGRASCRERV